MKANIAAIMIGACLLPGCRRQAEKPAEPGITDDTLVGSYVSIGLKRSALGLSREDPVSRGVDSLDGVALSVSGYVHARTDRFLVIGKYKEREQNEGLQWIPYDSILTLGRPRDQDRNWNEVPEGGAESVPWRLAAVEGLMGMIGYDLTRLPEGKLELWIVREGEKEYLESVNTMPGRDQWLYIGKYTGLDDQIFLTVVRKETAGGGIRYFSAEGLNLFRKQLGPDHDWTKAAPIAVEVTGQGMIYAKLSPAE